MSVDYYTGPVHTRITRGDVPGILSEGAALLAAHTAAAVVSTEDELVNGEGTYTILIQGGGDRYFRMKYCYPDGNSAAAVTVERGYLAGGAFVSSQSVSEDHIDNGDDSFIKGASLIVVNGGAVWDLQIKLGRYYNPSISNPAFHLRCAELVSGLDGGKRYAGGVFKFNSDHEPQPFPSVDGVVVGGADFALGCSNPADAVYSVPAGKLMLFPSLLTLGVQNGMGAATVGGKTPYFMTGQASIPLNAYTEFLIDRIRYVSLGYLAIRST